MCSEQSYLSALHSHVNSSFILSPYQFLYQNLNGHFCFPSPFIQHAVHSLVAATLAQPHPLPRSAALQAAGHTHAPPTVPAELSQYQASKLVDYSSSDSSSDASSSGDSASTEDLLSQESDDSGASYER